MQRLKSKRRLVLCLCLALMIASGATASKAQQNGTKVSGTIIAANVFLQVINLDDTKGHRLSLAQSEGTNTNTGPHAFLDEGEVMIAGTDDLVNGTGPGLGYTKIVKGEDAVYLKREAKITTTIPPKGEATTTFEGTFTFTKGAGQYQNIRGSGTYKGKYVSKTIYRIEWEGEYTLEK
jgi:hypothetical protein